MKRRICLTILLLMVVAMGCTSKRGIIELHTKPFQADIYVDDTRKGQSPAQFEYDFSDPATLKIEKYGYSTETETLDEAWVIREIRKGNYTEGDFKIKGKTTRAWKVTTTRVLHKK